jgi:hypothetical protein
MHRHETRLRALATRLRCCAQHLTPLFCLHAYEWTSTEAEWKELEPLADRLSPYVKRIRPSDQHCEQCGEDLWCR